MAESYFRRQLMTNTETAFAENAETGSPGWNLSIPALEIDFQPAHERIPDGSHQARLSDRLPSHIGVQSGTLRFKTYFPGHMTTTNGAITEPWHGTLLRNALGMGAVISIDGGTVSTSGTATSFSASDVTWVAGALCRVGTKGDGVCDGMSGVVASATASTATFLTAFPAAPLASSVVYGGETLYYVEGGTLSTRRFGVLHATTSAQYCAFGCQLANLTMDFPMAGDLPTLDWTYNVAAWRQVPETFPNTDAVQNDYCAPVAGGQFWINNFATATRAVETPSSVQVTLDMPLAPQYGPGGAGTYQNIVGWSRVGFRPTIEFTIPWTATYDTWFRSANQGLTYKHVLFQTNPTDGRAVCVYMPRIFPIGRRPTIVESNQQNYVKVMAEGRESTDTTSDCTRSAIRIALM